MVKRQGGLPRWAGVFGLAALLVLSMPYQIMALTWQVAPTLTLMESYTDNVFLVEESPEGDAVTTGIFGLSISYGGKSVRLGVNYRATVLRYARLSALNNVGHNASIDLGLDQVLGSRTTSLSLTEDVRFSPELSDGITNREEGGGGELANQGILVSRGDTLTHTAALTLTHQSSRRFTESIRYGNTLVRYEDPGLIDSDTHEGALDLTNQLGQSSSISASYSYRYFDYQNAGDAQSHSFTLGGDHRFSSSLFMTANIGASYVIQPASRATGIVGGLSLSKEIGGLGLNVAYSRNVSSGGGLSSNLVTTQTVSASLAYTLTQNVHATFTGRVTDNSSLRGDVVEILSWTAGAALSYQIRAWLSSGIRYHHLDQRVRAVVGNDLSRNQYIFNLTATLP